MRINYSGAPQWTPSSRMPERLRKARDPLSCSIGECPLALTTPPSTHGDVPLFHLSMGSEAAPNFSSHHSSRVHHQTPSTRRNHSVLQVCSCTWVSKRMVTSRYRKRHCRMPKPLRTQSHHQDARRVGLMRRGGGLVLKSLECRSSAQLGNNCTSKCSVTGKLLLFGQCPEIQNLVFHTNAPPPTALLSERRLDRNGTTTQLRRNSLSKDVRQTLFEIATQ